MSCCTHRWILTFPRWSMRVTLPDITDLISWWFFKGTKTFPHGSWCSGPLVANMQKKHHCFETCQRNLCVRGTLEHFRDWVKLRKLSNKPRKLINSYQFMVWLLASAYFKSPYLKTRADDPDLCWWHQSPVQSHRLACESIFLNWCDLTIGKAFLFGCTVAPLNFPLKQSIEKSVKNCDIAGIAWLLQRTNPSCWAPWRAKAELLSVPWAKKIRGFALSHMV